MQKTQYHEALQVSREVFEEVRREMQQAAWQVADDERQHALHTGAIDMAEYKHGTSMPPMPSDADVVKAIQAAYILNKLAENDPMRAASLASLPDIAAAADELEATAEEKERDRAAEERALTSDLQRARRHYPTLTRQQAGRLIGPATKPAVVHTGGRGRQSKRNGN